MSGPVSGPVRKFVDRDDWRRRHLSECPHCFPVFRSTVSRTYMCFYSVAVSRCMWRPCPLKEKR